MRTTRTRINLLVRLCTALPLAMTAACGLADDHDEEIRHEYIRFTDSAFEEVCLSQFDLNRDGRFSRYEAQRVVELDCSDAGIRSLWDISEFKNLRRLDCSGNLLSDLDLTACPYLERVDCHNNDLWSLNVDRLRSLGEINCSENALERIDLTNNGSLRRLDCRANRLRTLDLTACSRLEELDARTNPALETVYLSEGQDVAYRIDGDTRIVRQ